jgi:hypothetical protein
MKQAAEKFLKSKPKDRKGKKKEKQPQEREKSGAKMCRLKNHDHAWSKCPNNPISKYYSGKSYTEIPTSERFENDFAKKTKRMTKEKKEAKKKVSSKNGDCLMIQKKTPMVRISSDLDYKYDDDDEDDFYKD